MSASSSHVVLDDEVPGLRCSNCAALHIPEPPMTVEQLAAVCRGFVLMHKHCAKPVVPSKQTELFDALKEKELQRRADMFSNAIDVLMPLDAIELRHLVTCVRPREFWPSVKEVESWHADVRADVQRWCRAEHAHASPIAGHSLPARSPMPNVLANLELSAPKKKAGARPLSSGAKKNAKARKAAPAPNGSA